MANSLYQQMTANQTANISPQVQQIKSMVQMLKGQANPMQVIQSMAAQNPQLSQVINMLNGSGMSAKDLFMQTAQQRGIDPNMIIDMLK